MLVRPPGCMWHDRKAHDGLLAWGYRKVRKGGVVHALGEKWQDDELLPFVGEWVIVEPNSYWWDGIVVYPNGFEDQYPKRKEINVLTTLSDTIERIEKE